MTTAIIRHPDDATLMSFAAGSLAEPLAAVVAAHVAMCPRCRSEMRALDALGGLLLMRSEAGRGAPVMIPARPATVAAPPPVSAQGAGVGLLPEAFLRRFGLEADRLRWRRLAPGVRHIRLPLRSGASGDLRLLEIAAGMEMPEHGHGGTELTLVLSGSFHDATGIFGSGDVQDVDDGIEHQPIVDADGCVCLVASEAQARFKSVLGRLLQPWTGM